MKGNAEKFRNWKFLIGLALVFLIIYGTNALKENELAKNGIITTGKVTKFRYNSSGNFIIEYNYIVENKEFTGHQSVEYFKSLKGVEGCVGRTFKIKYSKKNHKMSEIDLEEFNDKKF